MVTGVAILVVVMWVYLVFLHGGFWRCGERDDIGMPADPAAWPSVTAVIPARDEAGSIAETITSVLGQDYPGAVQIVLVDDESRDGTGDVARAAAERCGASERLAVLTGGPLPGGWTGKLWAVNQGVAQAVGGVSGEAPPDYLLLMDADIVLGAGALRGLVARAVGKKYVLTSCMAKLRCESLAERALVPAFIFFFQMLYPFPWVNRADRATAAAAGGCMLVRPQALRDVGGIAAIRGALIDDCALAATLKPKGPIWLGLSERVVSIRAYESFDQIRRMVARSAYAQLHYSVLLLAGTVVGMGLLYLAAPALALFAGGWPQVLGWLAWGLMALAFQPTLRLYARSPVWGAVLPLIALVYVAFTIDSAYQHGRGRGGLWKGRVQAEAVRR
jgi:hopene-associated glycosyltransferase HpnB